MIKLKEIKGITILSLVITIVILLILAGISIATLSGENGLFTRAREAREKSEKEQLKEELNLAIMDMQIEKTAEGKEFVREDLLELSGIGATIESTGIPAEGEYKDYFFEIDENYVVTVIGKLKGEKPTINGEVITTGIVATGGTVEIKVTASISEGTIQELIATNGAVLKTETSSTEKIFEVTENGKYYFKAKADNGRSATVEVVVNTIIETPKINIKDVTETSFTIVVTNDYVEGLVTEYKYYVEGSLKSSGTTEKEYIVSGLTADTEYKNIYVEAYFGSSKLTSEVKETKTINITIKPSTTKWTNKNIQVEVEWGDNNNTNVKKEISIDGGTTYKQYTGTFEVEKNTTIIAKMIIGETEVTKELPITNIDKLPPKDFTPTIDDLVSSTELKINANTTDAEATEEYGSSGIKEYQYYVYKETELIDKSEIITSTNWNASGLTVGDSYNIYVYVRDNAGNMIKSEEIRYTKLEVYEWEKYSYTVGYSYTITEKNNVQVVGGTGLSGGYRYSKKKTDFTILFYNSDKIYYYGNGSSALSSSDGWDDLGSGGYYFKPKSLNSPKYMGTLSYVGTIESDNGWYKGFGSTYTLSTSTIYKKGTEKIGIIRSNQSEKYPEDGYQNGYWYVRVN